MKAMMRRIERLRRALNRARCRNRYLEQAIRVAKKELALHGVTITGLLQAEAVERKLS